MTLTATAQSEARERCKRIRDVIIEMSYRANSAHLGSSLSCVEILDAIVAESNLRADTVDLAGRDRIVVSKGHAAMAYYAVLHCWGMIDADHIRSYLDNGTMLWGHVTRHAKIPAIDCSTGSLGHGLSYATGLALAYRLRGHRGRIFCVLSDGECDEGSTWEAALFAGHHRLSNLTAVVDYNKIQSIGTTAQTLDLEPFDAKWAGFRWSVGRCDGHDRQALADSFQHGAAPRAILADTVKGKGIPRIENTVASHYKPALHEDRAEIFHAHSID